MSRVTDSDWDDLFRRYRVSQCRRAMVLAETNEDSPLMQAAMRMWDSSTPEDERTAIARALIDTYGFKARERRDQSEDDE